MATTRFPPESTTTGWLTAAEMRTLEAVCEALFPPTPPPAGESDPDGYYARSASDLGVATLFAETLSQQSPETRAQFKQLLGLLATPLFGLVLLGKPQRFDRMPLAAREAALRKMRDSPVSTLRQGFQGLKRLAGFIYFGAPVADGANPNWPTLSYPTPPAPPSPTAFPRRIQPLEVHGDLTLTADAVVVGSGAGGGVIAGELTAAGKDVVIIEKGGYYSEPDFTSVEAEMMPELYLRRGMLSTADLSVTVLAGSCLGGGTLINWSTSLRTPPEVLAEWERDYGLTGVTSPEYAQGFEAVEHRLGINTADSAPNRNNAALQRGCEALGYSWSSIPRNASSCEQRCGYCGFGCPHGRKQSTMLTYLQDAHDQGARVLVRCTVERVLVERGKVTGVEGWVPDSETGSRRRVIVRTPVVVVAGGSVESPALLLRSGLDNPNIGRHLRLHPVAASGGIYPDPIETWTGSLQTVYSDQFAHLYGDYGFRLEVMPAHPGLLGLATPWNSGQEMKQLMTRARNQAVFIVLTRDTGEGHITLDKQGDPVLHYWPNERDRRHLIRGLQEVTRIVFAGGGTTVNHNFSPLLSLQSEQGKPGAVSEAQMTRFLAEIARRDIMPNRVIVGTAHQMGTCRLGGSARTAVANPDGQVYGVEGLYIGDASGFPTASGVNPMLSTMALAYHVAQRIKARG
ncbi:MAG TPA: GMC family oxidoreductase N-terminal domain-containing protein [Ktedonobacterales bacterium]